MSRLLAATNKSLSQLVEKGSFREDLFYRIHVIRIVLPSLRDRREDIPLLTEHFIARLNRLKGKDIAGVSDEVLARLMEYDFPGNVRELENILEHAFILCRGGLIETAHPPPQLRGDPAGGGLRLGQGLTLEGMERLVIAEALRRHHGNRKRAARELGINPSTLFRKLKNLRLPEARKPASDAPARIAFRRSKSGRHCRFQGATVGRGSWSRMAAICASGAPPDADPTPDKPSPRSPRKRNHSRAASA